MESSPGGEMLFLPVVFEKSFVNPIAFFCKLWYNGFDCKNVNCGVAIFYRRQEQDCCSHTSTFRFLEGICLRADAFRKAVMVGLEKKLTLYGFNNLTKTLSFNIFDVCYAKSEREKQDYIRYIDEQYNPNV